MASTPTLGDRSDGGHRLRRMLGIGVLLWVVLSLGVHSVLWLLLAGAGGGGEGRGGGDFGAIGEGGLVQFSVAGDVTGQPLHSGPPEPVSGAQTEAEPALPEPEPELEPEPEQPEPEPPAPVPERPVPERAPGINSTGTLEVAAEALENVEETSDTNAEESQAAAPDETAPDETAETASGAARASGTGSAFDDLGRPAGERSVRDLILRSAGHLPGSVAAQRTLLPDAAFCDDPVAGVWRAHKYNPAHRDWALFTLRVNRVEGDRLRGTITARAWNGTRFDSSPPPCEPGIYDYTVRMPGRGMARGNSISFGSRSYRLVRATCPQPFGFSYNPDRFSGTIDPDRQEFQSVNNDGGRDINAPYLFRRISCDPDG